MGFHWFGRYGRLGWINWDFDNITMNKEEIILYGKKCKCGRFIDFTKEFERDRKAQKQDILEKIDKTIETHTFYCDRIATSVNKLRENIKKRFFLN